MKLMKKYIVHCILLMLFCTQSILLTVEKKDVAKVPTIKIQILEKVEGALVEAKGPYNVYDPRTGQKLDIAFLRSSYYMYPTTDGIKWGQEFPGVYQLLIIPDSPEVTTVIGGKEYCGVITVYQFDGYLGFVNEVSIDDFTSSILSTKLQQEEYPEEMLAALAIGCRTDAVVCAANPKNDYWDAQAGTFGYEGSSLVRQDVPFTKAINSTKAMILVREENDQRVVFPINWIEKEALLPLDEMSECSKNQEDAKAILQKLFPNTEIVFLDTLAEKSAV
jgi:stage II sporulation protein D